MAEAAIRRTERGSPRGLSGIRSLRPGAAVGQWNRRVRAGRPRAIATRLFSLNCFIFASLYTHGKVSNLTSGARCGPRHVPAVRASSTPSRRTPPPLRFAYLLVPLAERRGPFLRGWYPHLSPSNRCVCVCCGHKTHDRVRLYFFSRTQLSLRESAKSRLDVI